MKLERFHESHLPELMTWFPDETALQTWVLVQGEGALAADGTTLIPGLARWGAAEFDGDSLSLFVVASNPRAIALYRRLGFSETPYPESSSATDTFIYMVANKLAH